jgi:hypothetical protein
MLFQYFRDKKEISNALKNIAQKDVHVNIVYDALAGLAKNGNKISKSLLNNLYLDYDKLVKLIKDIT